MALLMAEMSRLVQEGGNKGEVRLTNKAESLFNTNLFSSFVAPKKLSNTDNSSLNSPVRSPTRSVKY